MSATKHVLIELRVRMAVPVPSDWDKDAVEFWGNESSHCLGTEIAQLYRESTAEEGSCNTCSRSSVFYVRDIPEGEEITSGGAGFGDDWRPEEP